MAPNVYSKAVEPGCERGRTVEIQHALQVHFCADPGLQDPIGRAIVEQGVFPADFTHRLMLSMLTAGQRVLDLGAHIGTFALPAAALGCKVVAVEASPLNASLLRAAAKANNFASLRVIEAAASDRTGRLLFSPYMAWGHVRKQTEPEDLPSIEVLSIAPESLLEQIGWTSVDFVKLDLQGWEPRALKGLGSVLSRADAPALLFESNAHALSWYGYTPWHLLSIVETLGYQLYLLDRVESGQLVLVGSEYLQTDCVADYLAIKCVTTRRLPWPTTPPLTVNAIVTRLVAACAEQNRSYRSYPARVLKRAPQAVLRDRRIQDALRMLRGDCDPEVAKAAAWSWALDESDSMERYLHNKTVEKDSPPMAPHVTAQEKETCCRVRLEISFEFVADAALTDPIARHLVSSGRYTDEPPQRLVLDLLRPGDRFLDVGAHLGTFALPAAAMGCHVLAVEANPRQAELLRMSKTRNRFDNLQIVQAAASDASGTVAFVSSGPWGFVDDGRERDRSSELPIVKLPAVKVDDLLDEIKWKGVDLVKIDVEGWELRVVGGMRRLLSGADGPLVLFECNAHGVREYGQRPRQLFEAFEELGYRLYMVDRKSPGQLVPVEANFLQPDCVTDFLAAKQPMQGMPRWQIVEPFSIAELAARFVEVSADPFEWFRVHVARTLRDASAEILALDSVRDALRRLRADLHPYVRDAAAWSEDGT